MAVLGMTAVGVIAAAIAPGLAGSTRPHPTLTGSLTDALSILANNLRVLAVPFLLGLLRLADSRVGRVLGDITVAMVAGLSAVTVGIALGRWRARLIPYLPHLPLEWAALAAAVAAWLLIRTGYADSRQLLALGSTVVVLLCAAAAVETWATPHRQTSRPTRRASGARGLLRLRVGGLIEPVDYAGAALSGAAACPSLTSRRGARAPADRRHINHRPPGGITVS